MADIRFPSTSEIRLAMEMASSSEGSNYLEERIAILANKAKFLNDAPEVKANVISAVHQYADYTKMSVTVTEDYWSGEHVETSKLKNMHKNLAARSITALEENIKDLQFDYAVSQEGHYKRGYMSKGQVLDSKSVSDMDQLFNTWLTSKDYFVKDGYISKISNPDTPLTKEEVIKLLAGEGLKEFLEEKGFNVAMRICDYPGEEKVAKAKQEATPAKESASETAKTTEPEEAPQAGTRAGTP